ncbi:MAG: hypothetical protein IR158_09735 [Cellulomonas sp.]|uniref:hypothetical protein n=1 Tax=Cellulomonas sp. TaxID=40001 RepID=UPI0019E70CCD|nr:hypothetical protein [Cellulomonas sp.]MBF0688031.1 hypothetical protein [Cellulomonas sp.]
MSADHGISGIPAARPVEAHAYREEPYADTPPWYRDGYLWAGSGVAVLALATGYYADMLPAALATTAVISVWRTVQVRRAGVRWWTWLEIVLAVLFVVVVLAGTDAVAEFTVAGLAVRLAVGALVGVVVVALLSAVRRRRAAPAGPATAE